MSDNHKLSNRPTRFQEKQTTSGNCLCKNVSLFIIVLKYDGLIYQTDLNVLVVPAAVSFEEALIPTDAY